MTYNKLKELVGSMLVRDTFDEDKIPDILQKALYFQPVKFLVHCYETGTIDWRNLPVSI